MTNTLRQQVSEAMKQALKQRQQQRLNVIRLIWAQIRQTEIDKKIPELDDSQLLSIFEKMLKQRRESIRQYQQAGRDNLVQQEQYEITIIQEFLPEQLADAELETIITKAIATTSAQSTKDMGKVIALVKSQVQGRADMSKVSQTIKSLLSNN